MGNNSSAELRKKASNNVPTQSLDSHTPYYLPSTNEDIDRLQMQHFLLQHVWESNYSAPIKQHLKEHKLRVLDAGCGPGTWLLEMASENQTVDFYGVDTQPVFPSEIKPVNLKFVLADLTDRVPFDSQYFDYIRISLLNWCLSADQWPVVLKELFRVLRPGGWLEIAEMDQSKFVDGPNLGLLTKTFAELSARRKVIPNISEHLPSFLALFFPSTPIHHDTRTFLLGPRGGKLGNIYIEQVSMFMLNTIGPHIAKAQNMPEEEFPKFWKECLKELKDADYEMKCSRFWVQRELETTAKKGQKEILVDQREATKF
ncbi:2436_t:CDS:2 [Paraglomus brasilianum]|uniref:2436_t:CDS:1 n=1 Tax=Paraglomus brasilianum TaxID=144538 RepID=A0A9N8VT19_9GLOM|nr:2436_t:CDS:2 [Paraglomus brasilianum]